MRDASYTNAIEAAGLSKSYPGFELRDIDLKLPRGCIMGLIGENGAGKTTTVKLLLNAVRKSGGSARILGTDTTAKGFHRVKEDLGVVLDEVSFPDCMNAGRVQAILRNSFRNWDDKAFSGYMERFSLPWKKEFKTFSKGMKMKFGLAVALSHHPKLLILDEVTSGLDPVAREDVLELLCDFTRQEDHSILISSHIVEDLEKICDYAAFFHKGREILCEEKDRLLEDYGMLRCTGEELARCGNAVVNKRETEYGVTALVKRKGIPASYPVSPVTLGEIFVSMVKGR